MWERTISDSNLCERNTKTLVYKGGRGFGHESYGKERGRNKEAKTMEGNNFHPQGRQQLGSSTKVHIALGFLILALLTALQVKYQNSGNPFQTHGAIMSSFIVLVIGYALTLAGISQPTLNTSYLHIGRRMCIILGTSASSLLVEVLLPPWGILILILAISALMFAQLLCVSHQQILQCFGQIFQSIYFRGSQNIVWMGPKWFLIATASSFQSIQLFFNANCQLNREPSGKCSN